MNDMKICPLCGKEIPNEASFCVYCMTQLSPVTDVIPKQNRYRNKSRLSFSAINNLLTTVCVLMNIIFLIDVIGNRKHHKKPYA